MKSSMTLTHRYAQILQLFVSFRYDHYTHYKIEAGLQKHLIIHVLSALPTAIEFSNERGLVTPKSVPKCAIVVDMTNNESSEHDWRYKPPYKIYEKGDFEVKHEASCHCGRVQYQLNRDAPLDSKLCHCKECAVMHGAPYQHAAIFHKEDINFVNGYRNLEWYDAESKIVERRLPCKVRCSYCKTPIMDEGRRMLMLFPSLIRFESEEEKRKFRPRVHMFYSQRMMDIPDNLPKWSGMPKSSTLIEDGSSNTMVTQEVKNQI